MTKDIFITSGIYLSYRKWGLFYIVSNDDSNVEQISFSDLEKSIRYTFSANEAKDIIERICCEEKVILDFNKKIASVVVDKDYNYYEHVKNFFDPILIATNIEERYDPYE